MATKKGLTTKALAKATKRLLEDIPSGIPVKKKVKEERKDTLSKGAISKVITLHEQAMKENKSLNKKVSQLTRVVDEQKVIIKAGGVDKSVDDPITTKQTTPEEEEVDDSPANIPQSLALYNSTSGDGVINYEKEMENDGDEGVLESIDEFVGKNEIIIQPEAMQSTFTVDLCYFGDKPQPLNKQKFRNYMEKFEVIDYQIPDLPASTKSTNEKSYLTVPLLTHFKVSNLNSS